MRGGIGRAATAVNSAARFSYLGHCGQILTKLLVVKIRQPNYFRRFTQRFTSHLSEDGSSFRKAKSVNSKGRGILLQEYIRSTSGVRQFKTFVAGVHQLWTVKNKSLRSTTAIMSGVQMTKTRMATQRIVIHGKKSSER